MKTLAERLRYAMEFLPPKKIKGVDLARAVGVKPPSVSDWLSGKSKTMEGENLLKASKFLRVNPNWLASGIGTPQLSENSANYLTINTNVSAFQARMAPVLSWIQAGNFTNVESIDKSQIVEWFPLPEDCDKCFYLKVKGVSNEPDFIEDDYIVVDPTVNYSDMQSGDIIVVRKDKDATFKKLIIESDGTRYLKAINPNFHPNIIPIDEDCYFIGQVIDSLRFTYRSKRRTKKAITKH
ncbi:MAG: XRE family transcriptional regulator [Acinetobacter calcoaceticus]